MNATPHASYRWLFWCLALVGFGLDQASKYGIFHWLDDPAVPGYTLIPGAFQLVAQYTDQRVPEGDWLTPLRSWSSPKMPRVNHGALFGLGGPDQERQAPIALFSLFGLLDAETHGHDANALFTLVSLAAAVILIGWSLRASATRDLWLCLALGLILGGTLGNLFDRVVFRGVRDFLYWHYLVNWPVFNLADCCLVCGAGLLLVRAFWGAPAEHAPEDQKAVAQVAEV
jgi:lipoprotein signal peptidase